MNVDSIQNGIVLDHIRAGKSMDIYRFLHLNELNCSVAIIKNVKSAKMGRKDIIKIDENIKLDLDILGYIDPGITVNIIVDGKKIQKFHPPLPELLENVVKCKNPRCITTIEQEVDHIFKLVDRDKGLYRCVYCDSENTKA